MRFVTLALVLLPLWVYGEPRERARDAISHVETDLAQKVPEVKPLCDNLDVLKKKIDIGECELYCETEGEGLSLALISGGPGCSHQVFHPSFEQARGFAKIVYYDQRGCGQSDYRAGSGYSLNQSADDLDKLRAALGLERWAVLGHSFGGIVARCYAMKYPERVSGLILCCASLGANIPLQPGREGLFISQEEQSAIRQIRAKNLPLGQMLFNNFLNGDWKRQNYYKPTREEIARVARYEWVHQPAFRNVISQDLDKTDFSGAFTDCPIPMLIIEGEWDLTWNTDKPAAMARLHPKAKLVTMHESAHSPFMDEPELFFKTIQEFMQIPSPVDETAIQQWKQKLAALKKEKGNTSMDGPITEAEQAAIDEFQNLKEKIAAGEKYSDQSTPVRALASLVSAVKNKDFDLLHEIYPTWWNALRDQNFPDKLIAAETDFLAKTKIGRIGLVAEPKEGDICPIYLKTETGQDATIEIFSWCGGKWRKVFNSSSPNWHKSVPNLVEEMRRLL